MNVSGGAESRVEQTWKPILGGQGSLTSNTVSEFGLATRIDEPVALTSPTSTLDSVD